MDCLYQKSVKSVLLCPVMSFGGVLWAVAEVGWIYGPNGEGEISG